MSRLIGIEIVSDENISEGSSSGSRRNKKPQMSELERLWRLQAYDYEKRFCGHCNTTTDIKEANFFGR